MTTPRIEDARRWVDDGTQRCTAVLADLDDAALRTPSLLPDWSRGHVAAHLIGNAEAIGRLLHWAATGEERRMYPSTEQRNADIDERSALPAAALRGLFDSTAADLAAAAKAMPDDAWQALVVVGQERTVPARVVPWMRAREVLVHAVDLATGLSFADLPEDFLTALADDIVSQRGRTPDMPITMTADDADWRAALPGAGAPVSLRGSLAALTAYLAGRGEDGVRVATTDGALSADRAVPPLSPWL